MSENNTEKNKPEIVLTRENLYNEIWEISLSGVAKKYGISYASLRKECADADIPVPPPGYWSQIECGKDVVKTPLPQTKGVVINLSGSSASRKNKKALNPRVFTELPKKLSTKFNSPKQVAGKPEKVNSASSVSPEEPESALSPPETFSRWGQTYNVYDRETLYKEVWQMPVTEVAKKYSVSDVTIHKVCKSLDIPTPPPGYWAKLRAGKPVTIPLLPKNAAPSKKTGPRTEKPGMSPEDRSHCLGFLQEEEREIVLTAAEQIWLSPESEPLHPKITEYQIAAEAWEKSETSPEDSVLWAQWQDKITPPFLWEELAPETQPRVYRIIDSLIRVMEPLGCLLTENLDFIVRGEKVTLLIKESKKKTVHVLTKQERKELLLYQEAVRNGISAQKPSIRKYDYVYKGRLSLHIDHWKEFRDSTKVRLEERLGEILICLYESSEIARKEREERENARLLLEKERRCREEGWEEYNAEVEKTLALKNQAEDYALACKIRTYIAAVENKEESNEKTAAWIAWAKNKADWYDPLIAREDENFGQRKHDLNDEEKELRKSDFHRYW
ncbi:MAG TPA: hypothetical protein PKD52_10970 [Clostridiales bacterium]|nr:hypothetical protein [Clostridiales bacterium]